MTLKRIGFFPEMGPVSTETTTLAAAVGTATSEEAQNVAAYLRSGVLLAYSPGIERDVLDKQHPIIGSGHIFSDGTWEWSEVLAHYVETYRVHLRDEFVAHARALGWKVPAGLDPKELARRARGG